MKKDRIFLPYLETILCCGCLRVSAALLCLRKLLTYLGNDTLFFKSNKINCAEKCFRKKLSKEREREEEKWERMINAEIIQKRS